MIYTPLEAAALRLDVGSAVRDFARVRANMPQGGASETTADKPATRADIRKLSIRSTEDAAANGLDDFASNGDLWTGTECDGDLR